MKIHTRYLKKINRLQEGNLKLSLSLFFYLISYFEIYFNFSYVVENYRISEWHFFYIPATWNKVKQQRTKRKFGRNVEENLSKIWKNESLLKLILCAAQECKLESAITPPHFNISALQHWKNPYFRGPKINVNLIKESDYTHISN